MKKKVCLVVFFLKKITLFLGGQKINKSKWTTNLYSTPYFVFPLSLVINAIFWDKVRNMSWWSLSQLLVTLMTLSTHCGLHNDKMWSVELSLHKVWASFWLKNFHQKVKNWWSKTYSSSLTQSWLLIFYFWSINAQKNSLLHH